MLELIESINRQASIIPVKHRENYWPADRNPRLVKREPKDSLQQKQDH